MDFLGIGFLEIFFILVIALLVLGPKEMGKSGRIVGRFLKSLVTSPTWKLLQQAGQEMRNIPTRLIREAGIEEMDIQLQQLRGNLTDLELKVARIEPEQNILDPLHPWLPRSLSNLQTNPISIPELPPRAHSEDFPAWCTPQTKILYPDQVGPKK